VSMVRFTLSWRLPVRLAISLLLIFISFMVSVPVSVGLKTAPKMRDRVFAAARARFPPCPSPSGSGGGQRKLPQLLGAKKARLAASLGHFETG
jgi:hypothetical protein